MEGTSLWPLNDNVAAAAMSSLTCGYLCHSLWHEGFPHLIPGDLISLVGGILLCVVKEAQAAH